jgi:hypothetical protein
VDLPPLTRNVALATVAVGGIVGIAANLDQVSIHLNQIYGPVARCLPEQGECEVQLNVFFLLAVTLLFLGLLCVAGLVVWEIRFRPDRRLNKQIKRLKANKDRLVARINSIVNKLYGDADARRFNFAEIEEIYEVSANGDLKATHRYVLNGGTDATHFWKQVVFADGSSPSVESFETLKFEARVADVGKSVEYVEIEDGDRSKAVAVFFLPEIRPGEARTLHITYFWPRFMNDLISKDRTDFLVSYSSENVAAKCVLKLQFKFERTLGDIVIDDVTPRLTQDIWDCVKSSAWTTWTLASAAYPMGGKEYKFEIER